MGKNSKPLTLFFALCASTFAVSSFADDGLNDNEIKLLSDDIEKCLAATTEAGDDLTECSSSYVDDCLESPDNFTTYAMNKCSSDTTKAWDILLNRYYQIVLNDIKQIEEVEGRGDPVEIFKQAQRSWLKFRDDDCRADSLYFYGGTAATTLYAGCFLDMTIERTLDFYRQISL